MGIWRERAKGLRLKKSLFIALRKGKVTTEGQIKDKPEMLLTDEKGFVKYLRVCISLKVT